MYLAVNFTATGTSSGVGRSLVEVLLAAGDRVAATTRNAHSLASLVAVYSAENLLVVELDLSSNDQVKPLSRKSTPISDGVMLSLIMPDTDSMGRLKLPLMNRLRTSSK